MIRDLYCKTNNISTFEQCDALLFLSFILDKIEVRLKDKSIDCSNYGGKNGAQGISVKIAKNALMLRKLKTFGSYIQLTIQLKI